jgi:DNA-binding response OmpR family regulator
MAGTILLVEDDQRIAELVRTYLGRHGFNVVWATNGEQALTELRRHSIELTLLDLGLPDVDGLDICRSLAAQGPVIVVTARDDETDRVMGLELGADDYITKPFSPRELLARIRAVRRRTAPRDQEPELRLGSLVISRPRRAVTIAGKEISLTRKEFDLLARLAEQPGVVLSREALLEDVWGLSYPGGTRTVDVHVAGVRRKLEDPGLISTVHGMGYKVVPR